MIEISTDGENFRRCVCEVPATNVFDGECAAYYGSGIPYPITAIIDFGIHQRYWKNLGRNKLRRCLKKK